ncbi:hypothetical protein LTR64_002619 [Lithohypha guttulata]|uniref:uncharacterized protein n=1 Tax=Lithohypha guttulata TaxID=1690604 RepID=UPI002DDEA0A5|nr:hypothetical protein LTR51_001156 [Lithohypha guttulata]
MRTLSTKGGIWYIKVALRVFASKHEVAMAISTPQELAVSPSASMPKGYSFVKKGDVYVTKNCRKLTHDSGSQVYIVQSEKKTTLGIRVPRTIHNQVLTLNTATKAARTAAVAKKDGALETKTCAELLRLYHRIPKERIAMILKHTLKKNSGRVGRNKELSLTEVVDLAVRAHIRHKFTEYDAMLAKGVSREQARQRIQKIVDTMATIWGRTVKKTDRRQLKSTKSTTRVRTLTTKKLAAHPAPKSVVKRPVQTQASTSRPALRSNRVKPQVFGSTDKIVAVPEYIVISSGESESPIELDPLDNYSNSPASQSSTLDDFDWDE